MDENEQASAQKNDQRERDLNAREDRLESREAHQTGRENEFKLVMIRAGQRDSASAARDREATRRDVAADLEAWLNDQERLDDAETRHAAQDDRLHSAEDRASSRMDRFVLAALAEVDLG